MAYQVSTRYRQAVTASRRVEVEAEIRRGGVTVATGLQVVGGDITADRSADVRRTCRLTVVGLPKDLIPTSRRRTPLDIYGNELVIRAGIRYPDGSSEMIPQGVFGITSSRLVDTADGIQVELQGADRADRISKAKLIRPWGTVSGSDAVDAITALARDRLPDVEVVDLTSTAVTLPTHVLEEQADPWADGIAAFAEAAGAEAYFDRGGRLVVRDVPDPVTAAVDWEMAEGPRCTITVLEREYADSLGGANAVVVRGETTDNAPVWAVTVDTDPESPTYYGPDVDSPAPGGYGPRPVWIDSSLITTADQAQAVADARARALFGVTEQVRITCAPNPAVDPGDLVYVQRMRSGFADVLIVDSLSLPVGYEGDMQMTCWVRRSG